METLDAIFTRKSVRSFLDKEVEKEKIETLLKAAMASPSGVNRQPWKFVVVKNKDKKEEIKKATPFGKYDSPFIIITCIRLDKRIPFMGDIALCDLSSASENILLAAHDMGLGAVWCAIFPNKSLQKKIKKILDLKLNESPFSAIYVGYPDLEKDKSKVKDKFKKENIQIIE